MYTCRFACSSLERDENCYEHLGQHSATEDESSAASNDHIHQTIIMTQFPAEDLVVIPQGTQLHRRHQNCLVTMPVIMVSILELWSFWIHFYYIRIWKVLQRDRLISQLEQQ